MRVIHAEEVAPQMDVWLAHQAWDDLAGLHNVVLPDMTEPKARAEELYALSDVAWNLRERQKTDQGKRIERQDMVVDDDIKVLDEPGNPRGAVIMEAGVRLRMINSQPLSSAQKSGRVALGATARSSWQRIQWSMGMIPTTPTAENSNIPSEQYVEIDDQQGDLFTIGSYRFLGEGERKMADLFMPEADRERRGLWTEADIMRGAAVHLMGLQGIVRADGPYKVEDVGYESHGPGKVTYLIGNASVTTCLEAPNPVDPVRVRADTDDGFRMMYNNHRQLFIPGSHWALSTNALYGPFQTMSFLNQVTNYSGALPVMATYSAEQGGVQRHPSQLIPEFHSAVKKMHEHYVTQR